MPKGAKSGGLSCIASAAAVHNEILATRPDLLEVLYQPYYSDIRGEEPNGRKPYYAEPRFSMWQGKLFCQHGRTYINSAQRFPEVPRLTPVMIEAMELIDKLANSEQFRLDMDFRPGDIQFLNNRVVIHRVRTSRIIRSRSGGATCCACGCARRDINRCRRILRHGLKTWTTGLRIPFGAWHRTCCKSSYVAAKI